MNNPKFDVELFTKSDLEMTKLDLKKDIEVIRKEIKEIELRLLKWMIGLGITSVITLSGIMYTLLKVMLHS